MIFYCVKQKHNVPHHLTKQKRFITSDNILKFRSSLKEINFTDVLNIQCPNEAYDAFNCIVTLLKSLFHFAQ